MDQPWWQPAVLYQVYVRSFADSDDDGVGDLRGVIDRLDYLEWLGVDALWLSPVTVSPDTDWGYDVADYVDVQPVLGDLATLDELVARAGDRGIRILLDLVPNHTSDQHPWFVDSRSSRETVHRDWYVWADPKEDGSPPNNWRSSFGEVPAWTLDEHTGQMYLHNFLATQPDLNWWAEAVHDAFDDILRFWFDRGIAGFRIDVAHGIVKDRLLRDNPVDHSDFYNRNQQEVHDVYRRWRRIADSYDEPRILLGETWVMEIDRLATYVRPGDELHLAFNFPFAFAGLEADALPRIVGETELALAGDSWPVWMLSNHDIPRMATRICGGDERKIRCALLMLLTLRGTSVLYQGDELGLGQVEVPVDRIRDVGGRDGSRTPMPWTRDGGWRDPWLPLGPTNRNVEDERDDGSSALAYARELIARRRASDDLRSGDYESLPAPRGVWAYRRGRSTVVALNLSDRAATFDGERLAPWEGAIRDV